MSDFLDNLLDRSFGGSTEVRPRTPSLFETGHRPEGANLSEVAEETVSQPFASHVPSPEIVRQAEFPASLEREPNVPPVAPHWVSAVPPETERDPRDSNLLERLLELEQQLQTGPKNAFEAGPPLIASPQITISERPPNDRDEAESIANPLGQKQSGRIEPGTNSGIDPQRLTKLEQWAPAGHLPPESAQFTHHRQPPAVAAPVLNSKRREASEPTVTVTIGRVELRSPEAAPAAPVRRKDIPSRVMSLEKYLQLRSQGELT